IRPEFRTGYRFGLTAGAFVAPRLHTYGYAPSSRLGRGRDPFAEPGTIFRSDVLGDDVRIEEPGRHRFSGGSALPPASRPSRRIRSSSSVLSPSQGPAAAIKSPRPAWASS